MKPIQETSTAIKVIVAIVTSICSLIASASSEILLNPAITGSVEESKRGSSSSKDTTIKLNISAGMTFNDGIFAGVKYYSTGVESIFDSNSSGSDKAELMAYGLSAGYTSKANFSVIASYLLNPESSYGDDSSSTKLYGGHGYLLDLGWRIKAGPTLAVGPQLSYLSVSYKKMSVNGMKTDLDNGTWQDVTIQPYFGFWLFF